MPKSSVIHKPSDGRVSTYQVKPGRVDVAVPIVFSLGGVALLGRPITRIRICQEITRLADLDGRPAYLEQCTYLDGFVTTATLSNNRHILSPKGEYVPNAVTKVQTDNITDFGRFEAASGELLSLMSRFTPENPPNEEQEEIIYRSYGGLCQWMDDLRKKVEQAEGGLSLVAAKVRDISMRS